MPDPGYFTKLRRFLEGPRRQRRRIRGSCANPPLSPALSFSLEALEPRVLLAADLASAAQAVQIIPEQQATVLVTNPGTEGVNLRNPAVAVYASQDTDFLSPPDVSLGVNGTRGNLPSLRPGENQQVSVALNFSSLAPGSYHLLSVVDFRNTLVESNELNNIGIGPTILKDADGTVALFNLTGPGQVELLQDGSQWDVRLTGTTGQSLLNIQTTGGNGRVSIDDIHVQGPLGALVAGTMDLTGNLTVDGPVTAGFLLGSATGATITAPVIQGTTIQGVNVQGIAIGGNLSQSTIEIGGALGNVFVGGSMSGSAVQAGSITSIRINGTLSADSRFLATSLPANATIGGQTIGLAGDPRFVTDNAAPVVTAQLKTDTGTLATDQLTFDPTIIGSVTDASLTSFKAGFAANPTFDVLADRQANSSFEFSRARLEQINGGPLTDGQHTLALVATDQFDRTTQTSVTFTLDTTIATLTLDLDPGSDTAPVGDQQTTAEVVTLEGETEAGALVELVGLGRETTADGNGDFSFAEVSLVLGANAFTAQVTDTAGNQRTESRTITRMAANQAPIVNDQSFNVAENSTNGTVVGMIAADDPDAGDTRTFTVTGGTGQTAFAVNATTGEITVADGTVLNFENTPSFTLNVQVTDAGNLSDTAVITVNLTNANEVPNVNDQSFDIAENSSNGTTVGTVEASDPDIGDTRTFAVTGGTGQMAFAVNTATGQITVANGGLLDFESTPSFTLNVQVMDAGNLSDTALVTIGLIDVPEVSVSFRSIGDLSGSGFYSQAFGVSANGAVVVGESASGLGNEAFRWEGGTIQPLGDLPGGAFFSYSRGTDADGSVVVGGGLPSAGQGHAFRWENGVMQDLGDLPTGQNYSGAWATSADGSIVVGFGHSLLGQEAFRWTATGGMVGLGDLRNVTFSMLSEARSVSADGNVVVGYAQNASASHEAFRWTPTGGMVGLGDLPGGQFGSQAFDVSSDGSVVVGYGVENSASTGNQDRTLAFRWTATGGMVNIGDLPGSLTVSKAYGVSGDGSRIVGESAGTGGLEAFIWDSQNGMRSLKQVLMAQGGPEIDAELSNWTLQNAWDISADGKTIIGYGFKAGVGQSGWIATLA